MFYSILKGPPYDCRVEAGDVDGSLMVAVPIARNDHERRIVSVVCELTETVLDDYFWEFSFSIDVFALDDSFEPFRTHDRQIAAKFIPNDVRGSMMDVVCDCLKILINHLICARPMCIG